MMRHNINFSDAEIKREQERLVSEGFRNATEQDARMSLFFVRGVETWRESLPKTKKEDIIVENAKRIANEYLLKLADDIVVPSPIVYVGDRIPLGIQIGEPDYMQWRKTGVLEFPIEYSRDLVKRSRNGKVVLQSLGFPRYDGAIKIEGGKIVSAVSKKELTRYISQNVTTIALTAYAHMLK